MESGKSWKDRPRSSKSANLGDVVNILAECDDAVETIEQDDVGFDDRPYFCHRGSPQRSSGASDDGAVFDDEDPHSSPTTSHHSEDVISELPDDSRQSPQGRGRTSSAYTPMKQNSPFRNPSSVRAMQFDTSPPFRHSSYLTSPLSPPNKMSSPSRHGTPRSQSAMKFSRHSPNKKKEHALVLLHATILPVPLPYSVESMEAVLPSQIIENYKLLQDKISDTVLARGILIAHPREDYELLEERLLESLELKLPRILKCGHFHLDDDNEVHTDFDDDEDGDNSELDDLDICEDCGRRIRDGKHGSGSGSRRWDIKVYASNGLMRGGAWEAAWREMEKIDVEIGPWLPEDLKKELNSMREQELLQQARDRKATLASGVVSSQEQQRGILEERPRLNRRQGTVSQRGEPNTAPDDTSRLREIYGESYTPSIDTQRPDKRRLSRSNNAKTRSWQEPQEKLPLSTLVKNYLYVTALDRKNIVIALLILVIALLLSSVSINKSSSSFGGEDSRITRPLMQSPHSISPSLYASSSSNSVLSSQSHQVGSSHTIPQSSSKATPTEAQTSSTPSTQSQTTSSSTQSIPQPSSSTTPNPESVAEQEPPPDLSDTEISAETEDADPQKEGEIFYNNEADMGILGLVDDTSAHLVEVMED